MDDAVSLNARRFELRLPVPHRPRASLTVTVTLSNGARRRLSWNCSACSSACEHVGAAMSLVLEEKLALGLAAPPPERPADAPLTDDELVERALAQRQERAGKEKMTVRATDRSKLWSDYVITSRESGKSYRLALRGTERGASYCSCPDFRKNMLGTCKHIIHALDKLRRRFPAGAFRRSDRRRQFSGALRYGSTFELRLQYGKIRPCRVGRTALHNGEPRGMERS